MAGSQSPESPTSEDTRSRQGRRECEGAPARAQRCSHHSHYAFSVGWDSRGASCAAAPPRHGRSTGSRVADARGAVCEFWRMPAPTRGRCDIIARLNRFDCNFPVRVGSGSRFSDPLDEARRSTSAAACVHRRPVSAIERGGRPDSPGLTESTRGMAAVVPRAEAGRCCSLSTHLVLPSS